MTRDELIEKLKVGSRFYFDPYPKNIMEVVERKEWGTRKKTLGVTFAHWRGPDQGIDGHRTFFGWDRFEMFRQKGNPVVIL